MRVDLRSLQAERGASLVVSCRETVASGVAEAPFIGPVEANLTLTNLGSVLRVEGRLATQVDLTCDRCAAPFRAALETAVREELPWEGEEVLAMAHGAPVLLVDELARELLVLALPTPARCHPECPGLCGTCGGDLRAGPCGCAGGAPDPRLAPLARLRPGGGPTGPG